MPPKFAPGLKACCVAVVLAVAAAYSAEPSPSSPIGLTRDQVLSRYGDPKSQIEVGNRTVMFFAKERLVLRDGVVVEVEKLASEPARRPAEKPAVPTSETAPPAIPPPAPTPPPPVPVAGPVETPVEPTPAPPAMVAGSAPQPKVEIKLVRPPSTNYSRPTPAQETVPVPPSTPPPLAVENKTAKESSTPTKSPSATIAREPAVPTTPAGSASRRGAKTPKAVMGTPSEAQAGVSDEAIKPDDSAANAAEEKKQKAAKARRRLMEADTTPEPAIAEAFLTTRTMVIAFFVIGGGIGYLVWRSGQRRLELEATAVSRTPFNSPVAAGAGGALFAADLLSKLEWKRFEELVAAYYSKTGVVAERTKSSPDSPVHIKIFWKGEPRPFACVQCIAHPEGLVDVKPLQELVAVLTAEDIRRGYVITTGRFSVPARDYAEEKHITLLPGDIFLEKLNALPDTARAEIMQVATTGDYQTPSCPKCDAKMVRSGEDPSVWRCATHPDQVIQAWN